MNQPLLDAMDKLMAPAEGTATEWLLSIGPILEKQRLEEQQEAENSSATCRSLFRC